MDEREPLLQFSNGYESGDLGDHHSQFCQLVGARPIDHPDGEQHRPHPRSLYSRAVKRRAAQSRTYMFTATLVNTLLLTQVVLGAALTGLGASNSSRVLITVFGALNTIFAGVIAFLKSRGQPMRARMFRDDLSRVVDEIENSAVMWYGISAVAHGYDAIDTDEQVTVRSEVARLTRLYDKAVKTNTMNDPDMYAGGPGVDSYNAGLRKNPSVGDAQPLPNPNAAAPITLPVTQSSAPQPIAVPVDADPDSSPASRAPEPPKPKEDNGPVETPMFTGSTDNKKDSAAHAPSTDEPAPDTTPETKGQEAVTTLSTPSPGPIPTSIPVTTQDPDESPASAARLPKKEDSSRSNSTLVNNNKF